MCMREVGRYDGVHGVVECCEGVYGVGEWRDGAPGLEESRPLRKLTHQAEHAPGYDGRDRLGRAVGRGRMNGLG